jgi:hypothetical protein
MKEISCSSFKIKDLWQEFNRKRFAIPDIQREFVWDAKKACALLDSIYKKLPIGSVLIWDTDGNNQTLLRQTLHILPTFNPRNRRVWFLIDGQQRLSVLHQVRAGQVVVNSNGKTLNFQRIHFCLEADAPASFVSVRRGDPDLHFPVTEILADDWQSRLNGLTKNQKKRIRDCRRIIAGYEVPFIWVKTNRLEEVREAFIRINSRGTPLGAADRAFTRASRFDLRNLANTLRSGLRNGFDQIPRETLLQCFALARGERDVGERAVLAAIDKLEKKLRESHKSTLNEFKRDWKRVNHAIGKAVGYLVTTLGVPTYSYLPSDNMVSTLALFFYHNNLSQPTPRQTREICKWFWATGVGQRYAGRGFRRNIIKDENFFRKLATTGKEKFTFNDFVARSEVKNSDYSHRSGLTNAFFCLLSEQQPRYLENGDRIPVEHSTRADRKDKHHIFPKDLLKRNGFIGKQYNSICNVCFVVARENQSISNKKPVVYLEDFRHKKSFGKVMRSHLIPHIKGSGIWDKNVGRGFKQFHNDRCDVICSAFQRVAGMKLFRND